MMRLPAQTAPAQRGAHRARTRPGVRLSGWSCVARCVDSMYTATGMTACLRLTSASAFISCAAGVLGRYGIVSAVANRGVAECALGCIH